jgi:hypothetical protein
VLRAPLADPERLPARQARCASRQADRARRRLHRRASAVAPRAVTLACRHVSPRLSPGGPRAGAGLIGAPARSCLGVVTPATRHVSPRLSPGGPRAAPASSARQRGPASGPSPPWTVMCHLDCRQADRARRRPHRAPARPRLGAVTPTTRHVSPRLSPGGRRAGAGFIGAPARPCLGAVTPTTRHVSLGCRQADRALRQLHWRASAVLPGGCHSATPDTNSRHSPTSLSPHLLPAPPSIPQVPPPQRFLTTPEPRRPNLARSLAHPFPFHPQLFLFFFSFSSSNSLLPTLTVSLLPPSTSFSYSHPTSLIPHLQRITLWSHVPDP